MPIKKKLPACNRADNSYCQCNNHCAPSKHEICIVGFSHKSCHWSIDCQRTNWPSTSYVLCLLQKKWPFISPFYSLSAILLYLTGVCSYCILACSWPHSVMQKSPASSSEGFIIVGPVIRDIHWKSIHNTAEMEHSLSVTCQQIQTFLKHCTSCPFLN